MTDEPIRPFRWDLVRPDRLGSLLDGVQEPNLDYLDDLIECAGKVLARCGDAVRLVEQGRSPEVRRQLAEVIGRETGDRWAATFSSCSGGRDT
jgi:hypothetical protein